mmetsp:Transcript_317/g.450  ORF Transcript_317/g.450 Transcript_317/m.450 type:complete len:756 (+) Transcript_317:296-2563(+)
MISIGATALTFLDKATKVTGLASNIKSWVKDMLPTQHKEVRLLLERLCCRVDAITRPMQYCWLWASDKESCVSDTVYHCRKTLLRVEEFVSGLVHSRNGAAGGKTRNVERTLRDLRDHLRDLDFCVQSLSLSLHIVSTTQQQQFHPYNAQFGISNHQHQINLTQPPQPLSISPSCLLKASSRLSEMHTTGGDVATASGTLFRRVPAGLTHDHDSSASSSWDVYIKSAVWCVHHDLKMHKYSLVIQDCSPISTAMREETKSTRTTGRENASIKQHGIAGSSDSMSASLSMSMSLHEPAHDESSRNKVTLSFELEPSLNFRRISPGEMVASEDSASNSKADMKGLHGDLSEIVKVNGYGEEEQPSKHAEGFIWEARVANVTQYEYAFILSVNDSPSPAGGARSSTIASAVGHKHRHRIQQDRSMSSYASTPSEIEVSSSGFRKWQHTNSPGIPLETREGRGGGEGLAVTTLLYISRLCMYENFAGKGLRNDSPYKGECNLGGSGVAMGVEELEPLHTYASDEELAILLNTGSVPLVRQPPKPLLEKNSSACSPPFHHFAAASFPPPFDKPLNDVNTKVKSREVQLESQFSARSEDLNSICGAAVPGDESRTIPGDNSSGDDNHPQAISLEVEEDEKKGEEDGKEKREEKRNEEGKSCKVEDFIEAGCERRGENGGLHIPDNAASADGIGTSILGLYAEANGTKEQTSRNYHSSQALENLIETRQSSDKKGCRKKTKAATIERRKAVDTRKPGRNLPT